MKKETTSNQPVKLLLTGNPNVGKTALFNRLTGAFEHEGNWHGVTTGAAIRTVRCDGQVYEVTDLPGLYSLTGAHPDEAVSVDALTSCHTDAAVINVVDAGNLPRNLYLTLQLLELNARVVVVLNMADELERRGCRANARLLSKRLGVPVVAISARDKGCVKAVMEAVKTLPKAAAPLDYVKSFNTLVPSSVRQLILTSGYPSAFAALKYLEGDRAVLTVLGAKPPVNEPETQAQIAAARYSSIDSVMEGVIESNAQRKGRKKGERRGRFFALFERAALNRFCAFPLFLSLMAAVFFVVFGPPGHTLSELTDRLFGFCLYRPVMNGLEKIGAPLPLSSLIGDGVLKAGAAVLKFLPQIVLMFLCLALLEDSGYLSRVAFMSDGIFSRAGLSGRSVFTMIMGFGCSATAVQSARGLEEPRARKKTVLLTPFAPCSAKLPVFLVIACAFFGKGRFLIVFGLYALSLSAALVLALLLQRTRLRSGESAVIMELPPYRLPSLTRVLRVIGENSKAFLMRIATVVFMMNVIVWVLANFSFSDGFGGAGEPVLALLAGFISPVFKPLGFGNWRAVSALLSGIAAKEGVLTAIESLGGLEAVFNGTHPALAALAFLVFVLLYVPCVATVAASYREAGLRWTLLSLLLSTACAYLCALAVHSLGLLFYYHIGLFTAAVTAGAAAAILTAALLLKQNHKRGGRIHNCGACRACRR